VVIDTWLAALEERHLADLTFSEVTRALRALSSTYVERRERLARKSAFDSAGKRAAYALYYSPLHFLTVAEVARALRLDERPVRQVLDLGCGAGAAGAAWAASVTPHAAVMGIDTHPWALAEASSTYRVFGLDGNTRRGDAARVVIPRHADAIIAGWILNELTDAARHAVQLTLLGAAERGAQVLIIEPIAIRVSPWWPEWQRRGEDAGGRTDEWRFPVRLPELLRRLDRAAGLRHDVLTARTLYFAGQPSRLSRAADGASDY
jgi:predicted nicotinamide N-methyase